MIQRRQTYLNIVFLVAIMALSLFLYRSKLQLERAEKRILLLRILTPGRSKEEVVTWLGPPGDTLRDYASQGKNITEILVYKSSLRNVLNGNEDVWVVLDHKQKVSAVYYPDWPKERKMVESPR